MKDTTSGIHPAPAEFSDEQLATDPILHYFHYSHLPATLQASSRPFCDLARSIVTTVPRNAERTVALRKLLEAKDAAVRANVPGPIPAARRSEFDREFPVEGDVRITGGDKSEEAIPFKE